MQVHMTENMQTNGFNQEASPKRYGYQKSPVHPRGYQILKHDASKGGDGIPVGDYIVLDAQEPDTLSEKKVMNLVALLNGRKALWQLGHETKTRVLYNIVKDDAEDGKFRVLFYHLGQGGVSVENALFEIERDDDVR